MHKYKVYTGPTLVGYAANLLQLAGYTVSEGTEHVYVEAPNSCSVVTTLRNRTGHGWTHRDVQELS